MTSRTLALTALALWLITIAFAITLFIRGQTTNSSDGRQSIALTPAERDVVLFEMRNMLSSVQGIVHALNKQDLPAVATAARASGMKVAADINPGLMTKLPLEFKQLGMSVHTRFDEMAANIDSGLIESTQVMQVLANQLDACVQCHSAYRIDPVPESQ